MAGQLTAFDIGESMVKIVSVSGGQVKKGVCAQMPDNLVSDGVIHFNDAMADTLKATLSSAGMGKGKSAVILPAGVFPECGGAAYDRGPAPLQSAL